MFKKKREKHSETLCNTLGILKLLVVYLTYFDNMSCTDHTKGTKTH